MKPLVSVIVPNYNNAPFLVQCLESIIGQTYPEIEIIVVDDHSTDRSVILVEKMASQHPQITLMVNDRNRGVAWTRHAGMKKAKGTLVSTLDSDDFYYTPHKIAAEVNTLMALSDSTHAIAFSNIVHVNSEGRVTNRVMNRWNLCEGDLFVPILTRGCPIPRDFVFPRELYFEVGGFSTDLPIFEDWDLKIRLARIARFYYTPQDGVAYRLHQSGLSFVNDDTSSYWMERVFEKNSQDLDSADVLRRSLLRNANPSVAKRIRRKLIRITWRQLDKIRRRR